MEALAHRWIPKVKVCVHVCDLSVLVFMCMRVFPKKHS